MRTPISVGVVGDAGRARVLIDSFSALQQADLRWVCEELPRFEGRVAKHATAYTHKLEHLLEDEQLDAVVFATTDLAASGRAAAALAAGKHVLVGAPLAFSVVEAAEIVALARRRGCQALTYSPWLFRPGLERLRRLLSQGTLGEVFYVDVVRHVPRSHASADLLWGLTYEAVEVVLDLLGDEPVEANARSKAYVERGRPDVVYASLEFATGITAHVHASLLHAAPIDRLTIVGSDGTAVVESTAAEQRLSFVPTGAGGRFYHDLGVSASDHVSLALPEDESAERACSRFVAALQAAGRHVDPRVGADALGVVEEILRSCSEAAEGVAPSALLSELRSPERTVTALRAT